MEESCNSSKLTWRIDRLELVRRCNTRDKNQRRNVEKITSTSVLLSMIGLSNMNVSPKSVEKEWLAYNKKAVPLYRIRIRLKGRMSLLYRKSGRR
jgi:hypothetical protein